jgi:hypothetical protein
MPQVRFTREKGFGDNEQSSISIVEKEGDFSYDWVTLFLKGGIPDGEE